MKKFASKMLAGIVLASSLSMWTAVKPASAETLFQSVAHGYLGKILEKQQGHVDNDDPIIEEPAN